MVEAYTIDGVINVNTEPFESAIKTVTTELAKLGDSTKQLMEMGGGDWNFNGALNGLKTLKDDLAVIKEDIASMNTEFANTQAIDFLKSEIISLRSEMDAMKERIAEMGTVASETVTKVGNAMSNIVAKTSEEVGLANEWVSAFRVVDSSLTPTLAHLSEASKETIRMANGVQKINVYIDKMTGKMGEVSTFSKDISNYFMNESKWLKQNVALIEREATATQRRATALAEVSRELIKQGNEIKKNLTYEEEMVATENLFKYGLAEEMGLYTEQVQLQEQIRAINESDMAIRNGIASDVKAILLMSDEELAILREEIALEEQKLGIIGEENALINEQGALRQRNAMKGNQLDGMSYLPRRIGSMALTMWGFNEIMDIYDKSMQNMNAIGQQKAYTDLMKTDNRYLEQTDQNVTDITNGVNKMNKAINETYKGGKSLQQMYQKVDMQSVGANAMDSAFKYGVQADKLDELTEVMAIYGSEFVRQGRSQEDSILAVNDALDGEYRRLKEVNIGKEELEAHGYEEGDTLSMIKALREIAEERGYDVVAQKVTNLSDAITVLEIRIAQDLVGAFRILEPILTEVANDFIYMLDTFEWAFSGVRDVWNKFTTELDKTFGVQNVQKFGGGLLKFIGWAITLGITFFAVYKIVRSLKGMLSGLFGVFKKGEDVGGSVAKDTGGIAKTGSDVGFKQGFKNEFSKLGKNLGKMARVFIEFAIALAMAWALIREAMWIISDIGTEYEKVKPQFQQGVEFLKDYGIWIIGVAVVFGYLIEKLGTVPQGWSDIKNSAKLFGKLAFGMALTMGLIAEAIVLLNAPLLAIASIGWVTEWTQDQLNDGLATIRMFADALHYIESDDAIGWFIIGFVALSGILGFTADVLAVPLVIGIATTLGLVAEAIGLLILPLGAIALLGGTASALGEENIRKGADTIQMIGNCLKILEPTIRNLLLIDLEVFGVQLVDWGNKLITGKTGLQSLTADIIPSLVTFVNDFNNITMPNDSIDSEKVQAVTQMATDIPPLFNAMQNLNNAMGTTNLLGNMWGAVGGGISGKIGMGLKSKLDQLYNDVKDVMDFATKLGKINGSDSDTSAVTQVTDSVTALKTQLDLLAQTISTASVNVNTASKKLGSAIKVGFKDGASGFSQDVVSVLAKGISEVQQRYDTWHSGGETSAQKLADGFDKLGGKLKSSISEEMGYALAELDNYKDDFYDKGAMLGQSLVDGFKSKKGFDQNSPAKITKSIREELGYSMEALNDGRMLMYNGGVALGQALYSGYNSYGNLRTNVDVLANKGVTNEQLQATARNVQANNNNKGQVVKSFNPTVNIDMSNSTIIGVDDLDARIKASIDRAFVEYNSPNGAVGY